MSVRTHDLLRIGSARELERERAAPAWLDTQLARAPWVVVRRALAPAGLIAVGVRGECRSERCAAWLPSAAVREQVTPQQLAARRHWRSWQRDLPALAALEAVAGIMARNQLAGFWGPTGSVGFELASGLPTVTAHSDLDLIVVPRPPWPPRAARALLQQLAVLAVAVDVLVEGTRGAVALAEYARAQPPYLLRTLQGPLPCQDPWSGAAAA